jgi:hypothetical protein
MPLAMRPNSSIQAVFGDRSTVRIGPKAYSSAKFHDLQLVIWETSILARPASPSRAHDALAIAIADVDGGGALEAVDSPVQRLDSPVLRTQEDFEDVFL